MSGDWGTTHYRRKVANELGITVEALDRGLKSLEAQELGAKEYLSRSHSERLRAFGQILHVPLVRLAGVDGVSSLLPTHQTAKKKRSSRAPAKKKPDAAAKRSAPKRNKPARSTVPLKRFPWEVGPPSTGQNPKPTATVKPEIITCMSCFLPLNPHNGTCGCS